jgi:hypothetical protein
MTALSELVGTNAPSGAGDPVASQIRSLDLPLDRGGMAWLGQLIEACAEQVRRNVERDRVERLETARAEMTQAEARREAHAPRTAAAEAAYVACPAGSWVLALIMTPFFVACVTLEFVLSWVTLPLLLGIDQLSPVGVLLGVGPTGALAVLKLVIARLFEEPYQAVRHQAGALRPRILAIALMTVFLLAVGVLNAYTIVLLADVREDVMLAARALADEPSSLEYTPVDSRTAIVAVSLAASIDGAIFFLVAWNEAVQWRRRRSRRAALDTAESHAAGLAADVAKATRDVAVYSELLAGVDDAAKAAADRRRAELYIVLHEETNRQVQARSGVDATNRRLRALAAS